MEPRISLITLGVQALERSLRFYRDGLGLPTTWTGDRGVVFFQTQGVCLALYPLGDLAKDIGLAPDTPCAPYRGITLAHNVRQREDVDRGREAFATHRQRRRTCGTTLMFSRPFTPPGDTHDAI